MPTGCFLTCRIGTAGWSIPAAERESFPSDGSHLERYAARFNAVEINTSFYRSHRRTTYERWAASVGDDFRFSVKLPKSISHAWDGEYTTSDIERFADESAGLGAKLGAVLVQFPPKHVFHADAADGLFTTLRANLPCSLATEPRHASWFAPAVDALLAKLHVARVEADPPRVLVGADAGGWSGMRYRRLHRSPRTYYSRYEPGMIDALHDAIKNDAIGTESWCIFDNTASGAATANALELISRQ